MKAIIHTRYGPPEVLSLADVARPLPKANEVLIKVYASTVNRTDCGFRSAEYFISRFFSGLFKPTNQILGNEFAGVIAEVGSAVTTCNVGDKVFGYNDKTFGANAEYMVVGEDSPFTTMPDSVSFYEAVAITEGGHYALCDIRAAKVKAGQNVLVNGATGAIGSAAVQLLKYFGATVAAVCHSQHIALVKGLGADEVIAYDKQDFTQLRTTYDFVFDAVGKSTFGKCKRLLIPRGIYISTELGPGGQNPFLALITPLLGGKKLLFPIPTINKDDVIFLKHLVEEGHYKPVIDREYTLEQVVEATKYVETGTKTGNVVIRIA